MTVQQIATEERHSLVARLVAWQGLRRAEKLCRLLQLLNENESTSPLSEKDISARLFPRPANHDTADDSIVRVSMRQLRFKLQEYFAGPGAGERWLIEIPRGEYALHFVERTVAPSAAEPIAPPPELPRSANRLWLGLAATLAAGLLLGFLLGRTEQSVARDLPHNLLLRAMDGGKYSLTVVPGDVALRPMVTLPGGREPSLSDYLAAPANIPPDSPDDDVATRLTHWMTRQHVVSAPHTAVVANLVAATGELRTRTAVRHPRDMTVRGLQQNSYAFLAARLMNPMVDLFEPRLTLRCDSEGPNRRIGVVDTLAKPGERVRYSTEETREARSFARVALLPNLGGDGGRILLLSGMGPVGTEAAALFATDPAWLRTVDERLPRGQVHFEALIEARAANGLPVDLQLRIVRPLPAAGKD